MRRHCKDSGKTPESMPQARASGAGPKFLEVSGGVFGRGFLGNSLGFPHRLCQSSGCHGAEIRIKFENKINSESGVEIRTEILGIEWGGDPDENFRNRVERRFGWNPGGIRWESGGGDRDEIREESGANRGGGNSGEIRKMGAIEKVLRTRIYTLLMFVCL